MSGGLRSVVLAALLAAGGGSGANEPGQAEATAPVCQLPSHDRLLIRKGRDVCAGTLGSKGRPASSGYLPTACADESRIYRVDARGRADRCVPPSRKKGEN